MKGCGNETWHMTHGGFCRAGKQIKKLLLVSGLNGKDVDDRNKLVILKGA
jgi:hypothetical protein